MLPVTHRILTFAAGSLWLISLWLLTVRTLTDHAVYAAWALWLALGALVPTGAAILARERNRLLDGMNEVMEHATAVLSDEVTPIVRE